MNEEELILELKKLNIRQAKIITQLRNNSTRKPNHKRKPLKPADTIKLLTSGVLSTKGEQAIVTKISSNTVHLKVSSNGHTTYRKVKNVRKIQ